MSLSVAVFNRQLNQMGQTMLWRSSMLCPCRSELTGGADVDCPTCNGLGVFWNPAVQAVAGVVGAKARRQFDSYAAWEDGDVLLSVPSNSPLWHAREKDRVSLIQGDEPFQIVLEHTGTERLQWPIRAIERCFWLRAGDRSVVKGTLPRVHPRTLVVSWTNPADAPEPGTQYTLQGTMFPEYFVWRDIPISRAHFQGGDYPKRLLLKRFSLFRANVSDAS